MLNDPIVVGTDGSATAQLAVERAGQLAAACGAPVHVVTSYNSVTAGAWMAAAGGVAVGEADLTEHYQEQAEQIVDRAGEALRRQGLTVRTHVCSGDPAEALVMIADDEHAQMIVVGNKGMHGARRMLGSVPNSVSHHANCGVLIVPTS
jgi:nucleotide-binding universal stress UspA family protein